MRVNETGKERMRARDKRANNVFNEDVGPRAMLGPARSIGRIQRGALAM